MDNSGTKISQLYWPDGLSAIPQMHYESLALLYQEALPDSSEEHLSFVVQCSKNWKYHTGVKGCVHKVDVVAGSSFSDAKLSVTHEVLPDQGSGAHVIAVNDKLRVAGFDSGALIPIKNFGPKKTFNCDVRGRLQHECGGIIHINIDPKGQRLAACTTEGFILLYEVDGEELKLVSKAQVERHDIAAVEFLEPVDDPNPRLALGDKVFDHNNLLLYATHHGFVGIVDSRCGLRDSLKFRKIHTTQPKVDITTMCVLKNSPGIQAYIGSKFGRIIQIDLRYNQDYVNDQQLPEDGKIRRMLEVVVPTGGDESKNFLAYTNDSPTLKIVDPVELKPAPGFRCDRSMVDSKCMDVIQVGNRLVTSGEQTSIGCWVWEGSPHQPSHAI